MESLRFFRRTYKDPVVEYYFLPWRDDIRLTRRFERAFVHVKVFDPAAMNLVWKEVSPGLKSLLQAEMFGLALSSNSTNSQCSYPAPVSPRINMGRTQMSFQSSVWH